MFPVVQAAKASVACTVQELLDQLRVVSLTATE